MNDYWQTLFDLPVYQLPETEKQRVIDVGLTKLTRHHYQHCSAYRSIVNAFTPDYSVDSNICLTKVPAIATRLFKQHDLSSIKAQDVFKITTSSGTTSQQVSKVVLDKENINRQQKVLSLIIKNWLGSKRLPMLIIDHTKVIKDKYSYSARGVGIQGLSLFGHHQHLCIK